MATNEFTNLLTDHILAKTPGGTILIDSPINYTSTLTINNIDAVNIKADHINSHTLGGNVQVDTNLVVPSPYYVDTNGLQSNNGQPITVNFGIDTTGVIKTDNLSSHTALGPITTGSDLIVGATHLLKSNDLVPNTGTDITIGGNLALQNNHIKYGASNTSEIYESSSVDYFKTPTGSTFAPFVLDSLFAGFTTAGSTARTCVSNTNWYTVAMPGTNMTLVNSSNYSMVSGNPNVTGFQYTGSRNRYIKLHFSLTPTQSVAGSVGVNFAISKNPVINAVDGNVGSLLSVPIIIQTQQVVSYTAASLYDNVNLIYMGPVVTNDIFYVVVNHPTNGATCTVAFGSFMVQNISIGSD